MLSKKIAIPLVGICLIGLILGAYKASAAGNNTKTVEPQPTVAYQDEHIQKLSDSQNGRIFRIELSWQAQTLVSISVAKYSKRKKAHLQPRKWAFFAMRPAPPLY